MSQSTGSVMDTLMEKEQRQQEMASKQHSSLELMILKHL